MRFCFILSFLMIYCFSFAQNSVYMNLNDASIPQQAFNVVINNIEKINPKNPSVISIIDFTKPSTEKRFFIIDLQKQKILLKTYVAHGMGSGDNYAEKFSNTPNSKMSSAGFYITGDSYIGKHGYSLRLKGIEKDINDNAEKRAVVIHSAWYVSEDFISKNGRLGRSWGCPAVDEKIVNELIDLIKNGTILYIYTDDENYRQKTKFR